MSTEDTASTENAISMGNHVASIGSGAAWTSIAGFGGSLLVSAGSLAFDVSDAFTNAVAAAGSAALVCGVSGFVAGYLAVHFSKNASKIALEKSSVVIGAASTVGLITLAAANPEVINIIPFVGDAEPVEHSQPTTNANELIAPDGTCIRYDLDAGTAEICP